MEKILKKWFCVLLAVSLLATSLPLIAGAVAPSGGSASSSGQAPLKVEIKSNKEKYTLLGKMEFTATITNTSSSTVENISAEALFDGDILQLKKNSQIATTKESLAPGQSFQLRYFADLRSLKGIDFLIAPLFFVNLLFHGAAGSMSLDDNGFNDGRDFVEASKTVGLVSLFSKQYDASTRVRVWYGDSTDRDLKIPPAIDENHIKYDSSTEINYIDNSILVFFKQNTAESKKQDIIETINGKITWKISQTEYAVEIMPCSLQEIDTICSQLMSSFDEVLFATADLANQTVIDKIPSDPWNGANWNENSPSGENWGLEAIQAPSAWEYDNRFQNIGIGVVDDGFDIGHEDLKTKIQLVPNWMNELNDSQEHGTRVAGIIGAQANNNKGITGIVWNSTLYCMDWKPNEKQSWNTEARILAGLRYTVEAGAKVVNFSLGRSSRIAIGKTSLPPEEIARTSRLTSTMMQQLLLEEYDFVVVQSSGNGTSGKYNPSDENETKKDNEVLAIDAINNGYFASVTEENIILLDNKISKREILDRIIIVGNAKLNPDGHYQQDVTSNGGSRVDICAPGTDIYSTVPGGFSGKYASASGTSMAAPMVAGVVALVWSTNFGLKGTEVKEIVCAERNTKYKVYDNPDGKHTTNDEYRLVNALWAVEDALSERDYFGELGGVVKDKDTDTSLADVEVIAFDTANKEIMKLWTKEDGKFYMMLPEGQYTIRFSLDGYASHGIGLQIERNVYTVLLAPVYMQKGSGVVAKSIVSGEATEQGSNAPLSGVLVEATRTGTTQIISATTNASGKYSLTLDKGYSYDLKFSKAFYHTQTKANNAIYSDTFAMPTVILSSSEFAGGDGTAQNPYQISTPQQLNTVSKHLSSSYILINDIELTSWGNWEPISTFSGVFDGDKHVVKNMSIVTTVGGNAAFWTFGLFGIVREGEIRNLSMLNCNIDVTGNFSDGSSINAGGIAGSIAASVVNNCHVAGNIRAACNTNNSVVVGGIAGKGSDFQASTISNCSNKANISVSSSSISYAPNAGGIIGTSGHTIVKSCYNTGNVTVNKGYAGGIAGWFNSSIDNCYNVSGK